VDHDESGGLRDLKNAVAGNEVALQRLLLAHHDSIAARVTARLPGDVAHVISADDVLQQAYITAVRRIREFEPRSLAEFHAWLTRIADYCLSDLVRSQRCQKRGGGRVMADLPVGQRDASVIGLLELIARDTRTPTRVASLQEAIVALEDAMSTLPHDQRTALSLRHLEGLSVAATAESMGRTEGAVKMLCNRAIERLREQLGDLTRFMSRLP
jgi:RNA polymerase sigma-70 factor (ECF subfamily)